MVSTEDDITPQSTPMFRPPRGGVRATLHDATADMNEQRRTA